NRPCQPETLSTSQYLGPNFRPVSRWSSQQLAHAARRRWDFQTNATMNPISAASRREPLPTELEDTPPVPLMRAIRYGPYSGRMNATVNQRTTPINAPTT